MSFQTIHKGHLYSRDIGRPECTRPSMPHHLPPSITTNREPCSYTFPGFGSQVLVSDGLGKGGKIGVTFRKESPSDNWTWCTPSNQYEPSDSCPDSNLGEKVFGKFTRRAVVAIGTARCLRARFSSFFLASSLPLPRKHRHQPADTVQGCGGEWECQLHPPVYR